MPGEHGERDLYCLKGEGEMQEGISVLAAILWAVASGLVVVGIGICVMCLMFVARRADDASPPRLPKTVYMADYLKGKSAKEGQ